MIRLHLIVEGQTEETFVRDVLTPHLANYTVFSDVRCIDGSRRRGHRGGVGRNYHPIRRDIQRWLREDQRPDARFSTLFDLYGLPSDIPATDQVRQMADPYARVNRLEQALAEDIADPRFVPHIQLHEFEALLLSDPQQFDWEFLAHDRAIKQLIQLVEPFASPELIDDGYETAPSRRIAALIPEYALRKSSAGPLIAARIGLPTMRARCPHFDRWVTQLEGLAGEYR
jgi:hypothetical protein